MDRNDAIERKFTRFRVLIIGRANAGKTTILQRVCGTTEVPKVRDKYGKKIEVYVQGSLERGEHDIENEITFRSNPRYVFHDSRGFEAGRIDELKKVESFIAERAKARRLGDRIHAIWYCIPMTDRARAITTAEDSFFTRCGTSNVPVIAIFSKLDGLDPVAYGQLRKEGENKVDAKSMAPERSVKIFDDGDYVRRLLAMKYPPQDYVCLREMDKENADCSGLIECTAAVLKHETLEKLFVSTQQTNMELSIRYAINRTLRSCLRSYTKGPQWLRSEPWWGMQMSLASWFPHAWLGDLQPGLRLRFVFGRGDVLHRGGLALRMNFAAFRARHIQSGLKSLLHGPSINKVALVATAVLIILEHSFYLWYNKKPGNPLLTAFEQYIGSPLTANVDNAVGKAIKENEDHEVLCNAIFDIVLQNRLSQSHG